MDRIDSVVKSIIKKLEKQSKLTSDDVEKAWVQVAGRKASSHAKPASLRKKRLVVNVDGSGWLYELTLKKAKLLAGLKEKLGGDKIEGLQFRIGEL